MRFTLLFALLTAFIAAPARAEDVVEVELHLTNHAFVPATLTVPQGKKIKLTLINDDPTPAEFESAELNREKTVTAKNRITFFIGPLDPGTYSYFDDFHKQTTTGVITAE